MRRIPIELKINQNKSSHKKSNKIKLNKSILKKNQIRY